MALTAQQVAYVKTKLQQFTMQVVQFPIPTFTFSQPAPGAITWKPMPLLSPRYAFTTGAAVTISGTDSVIRPTTAVDTVAFVKQSGDGVVTDNADKTCTVTFAGVADGNTTVVRGTATHSGQTGVGFAYIHKNSEGQLNAYVSEMNSISGSLDGSEWQGEIIYQGFWTATEDVPILCHVAHTWDGTTSTFGGYKRDANTFLLFVTGYERIKTSAGEFTRLKVATPGYLLDMMPLKEMKFRSTAGAGYYSTASLTMSDVVYYILRECTNFYQYLNCSVWNQSASTIPNFNVRGDSTVWAAVKEASVDYNFGICYFNRWSNLNIKPSPRARYTEWVAIVGPVYASGNPLTVTHCLERMIKYYRTVGSPVQVLSLQGISPTLAVLESRATSGTIGKPVEITGLVVKDQTELDDWRTEYLLHLNRDYDLEVMLGMGHELNPGDLFYYNELAPGGQADAWFATDIDYRFNFARGEWTRRIFSEYLKREGGG